MESGELAGWMARSGFSATPLRWFCGQDGIVVVEQAARWVDADGIEQGSPVVASCFQVADGVALESSAMRSYGKHSKPPV